MMGAKEAYALKRADGKFYAGSHRVRPGHVVPQWNSSTNWALQYSGEQEATAAAEALSSRFGITTQAVEVPRA